MGKGQDGHGHFVFLGPDALTRMEAFCQGSVPLIKGKEGWKGLHSKKQTNKNNVNGLALGA